MRRAPPPRPPHTSASCTAQIANSLVFATTAQDGRPPGTRRPEPLLILASGAHRVDAAKVADLLELDAMELASAEVVREATGFVIGGVAPVGQLQPMRTLVDVSLARYDTMWAAAGHPHAVFATTYDELLRITGGPAHRGHLAPPAQIHPAQVHQSIRQCYRTGEWRAVAPAL